MPKLSEFPTHMMTYVREVIAVSGKNLREAGDFGSEHMKEYITGGSQTGSKWHAEKNELNGYAAGSRIGGAIYQMSKHRHYQPSGHAGQMLNSVGVTGLAQEGKKISIRFGWVKKQEQYFLLQDNGDYRATAAGKARGIGMGLLNERSGSGRKTLQKLGAYHASKNHLISLMKASGFEVSGGENE
jgi:hypothetical protein